MGNFDALQCTSDDAMCDTCPVPILETISPQTAEHPKALIGRFGLNEINMTLAGERMPTKFAHLVEQTEDGLPDLPRDPEIDEEHALVDSLHRVTRCSQYNEEK